MEYYNYGDDGFHGGYYRGLPAYHDREGFYDRLPPVQYRPAPFYRDGLHMRDYRHGGAYMNGGSYMNDGYRRGDWLDQGPRYSSHHYRSGGGGGGGRYRLDRYEHGGQGGYRGGHLPHHGDDDYMQLGDSYVSSRAAVELYVPICCDKCERKLRKHMDYIDGVESVSVDQVRKKVVVFGHVNPTHVLHRARKDKPESEFWHGAYYR